MDKTKQKTSEPAARKSAVAATPAATDGARDLNEALSFVVAETLKRQKAARVSGFLNDLVEQVCEAGVEAPKPINTPYVNTIPVAEQPPYPGDWQLERRIKSLVRWNAMAMVVNANRERSGIGGHISTYASCATLYEVGFNHFFHGGEKGRPADMVYFQGHSTPGIYARAFLEGRLDERQLHHFRQELRPMVGCPPIRTRT